MKYADYIKRIEIDSLWEGRKHIVWELDRHVNILSGVNGDGKSTILNRLVHGVKSVDEEACRGVNIDTMPEDAKLIRFDVVFMPEVRSDFDNNLNTVVKRFNANQDTEERKTKLYSIIERLFSTTEKSVDHAAETLTLLQWGHTLPLYLLSNGEKQMLTILLTVFLEEEKPYVLFMDEPEISLHMEWQKQLIEIITQLNPNVQVIMTTHSPAIIMNGWMDKVTEVGEITI
ncbi:MAG: AAA family ATPase [Prevotella sp.]|nr:AAA family ATPase [Candidatus Prevotella equi]